MLDPTLAPLLAALIPATEAGRIAWKDEGDVFSFAGSRGVVRLEDPGLWPQLVVLDERGYDLLRATIPSGDDAFDADLRALLAAVQAAALTSLQIEDAQRRALNATRDTIVASLLSELQAKA